MYGKVLDACEIERDRFLQQGTVLRDHLRNWITNPAYGIAVSALRYNGKGHVGVDGFTVTDSLRRLGVSGTERR